MMSGRAVFLAAAIAAYGTSSLAGQAATADAAPSAEAPMATAARAPQVADQIKAFIDSSPAAQARRSSLRDYDDDLPLPDRKIHGEVSVGVGNHGYRSAYARSDIPVGKRGTVSMAVGESRGRVYGYPYAYDGPGRHALELGFDSTGASRARTERDD